MFRSLSSRLILFSVFWIALALLGTGAVITRQYQAHIEKHFDAHVHSHLEELVAAVEPDGLGGARLARAPTDPRFYVDGSGWYWAILRGEQVLTASPSLGQRSWQVDGASLSEGTHTAAIDGPDGQRLRAQTTSVAIPGELGLLTFVASAPAIAIADDVADFSRELTASFVVLGGGLITAVVFQVLVAVRPIRSIRRRIAEVRAGTRSRLPPDFPDDLQPLVDELNDVLDHNEVLLRRARTQMADLAHALKNPLAVIRNAARNLRGDEAVLILDQSHQMDASINRAMASARMQVHRDGLAQRTAVRPVLDDLRFAVEHVHRDRNLSIEQRCGADARFLGEAQDLEEMIGNLLDNACKWARASVVVSCHSDDRMLRIRIDDDGPGIDEAQRERAQQRGVRLDETTPGHGQGLAIVRELAEIYGGELMLSASPAGGLRAELALPAA